MARKLKARVIVIDGLTNEEQLKVTYESILVTPELAKKFLEAMPAQRNLDQSTVKRYATDMINGAWTYNLEGIKFDENGLLMDGQHRMHAVIQSGCSIRMYAVKNYPRRMMPTLDRGRGRSFADQLVTTPNFEGRIEDPKNNRHMEPMLKLVYREDKISIQFYQGTDASVRKLIDEVCEMIGAKLSSGVGVRGSACWFPFYQFIDEHPELRDEAEAVAFLLKNGYSATKEFRQPISEQAKQCADGIVRVLTLAKESRIGTQDASKFDVMRAIACMLRVALLQKKRLYQKKSYVDIIKWTIAKNEEDGIRGVG